MGSDRARTTYDDTRQYRRVVPQQGRVILEADLNEQSQIASEDVRREVLDLVGPVGVPNDPLTHAVGTGYQIAPAPGPDPKNPGFDLAIGAGTIYVGGWRVVQPDPALRYTTQTDWIDNLPAPPKSPTLELVTLRLREQEVSATEDVTLREVALGGPDTAQRVRLIRHVERYPVKTAACSAFGSDVLSAWKDQGLVYDPATTSLTPTARLVVSTETLDPSSDKCDPAAKDGYLGAENQMIRVQIAGPTQLLWAYDNASALYRVDLDTDDQAIPPKTLKLRTAPVDAFHQPVSGQVVELLLAAATLDGADNYVAATSGLVTTLDGAYQPDTRTVVLGAALTTPYLAALGSPAGTPATAVYLRVWNNLATFTPGTPQPLIDLAGNHTGLQVTLTGGPFIPGTFWSFAVRPTTPSDVLPARYVTPQPPDGPREWACPLGAINWNATPPIITDCRPPFDNLVTLTGEIGPANPGCCTVTLGPGDLTEKKTLQTVIDSYKALLHIGTRVTICLRPGVYKLTQPVRFGPDHSGLAIEGCARGAVIEVAAGAENAFIDGMFVLVHANEVALRGLRFHLPEVPFSQAGGTLVGLPLSQLGDDGQQLQNLSTSIAIRPVHAAEFTVEDCLFRYSLAAGRPVFAAAIFAGSECHGHHIVDNSFVMDESYLTQEDNLMRLLFGYVLVPSVTVNSAVPLGNSGTVVHTLLDDANFDRNELSGLIAAALIVADNGSIRIEDNRVRQSYGGFWIGSLSSWSSYNISPKGYELYAFTFDPLVLTGHVLAMAYPAPAGLQPGDITQVTFIIGSAKRPDLATWLRGAARPAAGAAAEPTAPAAAPVDIAGKPAAPAAAPVDAASKPAAPAAASAVKASDLAAEELALAIRFATTGKPKMLSVFGVLWDAVIVVLWAFIDADTRAPHSVALSLVDNDIDLRIDGIATGSALVVQSAERNANGAIPPQGSTIVTANRLVSSSLAEATAVITDVLRIAITGNLIVNDTLQLKSDAQLRVLLAQFGAAGRTFVPRTNPARLTDLADERWSLVVVPPDRDGPPLVAITGNVFEGRTDLPARPVDQNTGGQLPPWELFNTLA